MAPYRNFDLALAEATGDKGDPVRFTVGGEDFEVYDLPVGSLMRALGKSELVLYQQAYRAMLTDEYDRFEEALIRSRFGVVELDKMTEWVFEQVAARPTRRSSDSPASPSADGPSLSLASANSEPLVAFS